MFTLYADGDEDGPEFKFNPPLLLFIELLLWILLLRLLFDFFSLRPFPLDSPLFGRELFDVVAPELFAVLAPIPGKPPGKAAAKSAG